MLTHFYKVGKCDMNEVSTSKFTQRNSNGLSLDFHCRFYEALSL